MLTLTDLESCRNRSRDFVKCKYLQDFVKYRILSFHHQYLSKSQCDWSSNPACVGIMGGTCKSPMISAYCWIMSKILEMANLQKSYSSAKKGYFHLDPNIEASFPF